jgi:hypothetical protein
MLQAGEKLQAGAMAEVRDRPLLRRRLGQLL